MSKEIYLIPFLIKKHEKFDSNILKTDKVMLRGIEHTKYKLKLPVYYENVLVNAFIFKKSQDKEEEDFLERLTHLLKNGIGSPEECSNLTKYFVYK